MDVLSAFLDGPRAAGAFLLRSLLEPPWSLRIQDEAPLTVVALVRGEAWVAFDDEAPARLGPGDVATIRGPEPYTVSDHPATPPQVVIHPGQVCRTPEGDELHDVMSLGVRTWGNDPGGSAVLLTGTYTSDGEVSRRLLDTLPPLSLLAADDWHHPAVDLLAAEIVRDEPGQEAVLDRLLDLVLVEALRATFAGDRVEVPAWYRASGDPVVGPALRLMHEDPSASWTVAGLAAEAGVSRAALARRFHELVGEPPDGLPDRLADGAGRRSPVGARRDGRRDRPPGGLRQPVHLQHRLQAHLRPEPAGVPGRTAGDRWAYRG